MTEIFDYVYRYTRAEAIEDGILLDVTELAREAGFRVPVAVSAAAWGEAVVWTEDDAKNSKSPQDEQGRLWDVLWMSISAIRRHRDAAGDRLPFTLLCVPRGSSRAQRLTLHIHIGGGDECEPVMTILLPNED